MATQAPFEVPPGEITSLITGLTEGSYYLAQNISSIPVRYANAAAEPTEVSVGWHILEPGEWMRFEVDTANIVWVRTGFLRPATLVISDAP